MLPDSMYEYRYERKADIIRCHCCDDEIKEGYFYYYIDEKIYCFHCVDSSRLIAGVD